MIVWIKLGQYDVERVNIEGEGGLIMADLKDAVKAQFSDELQGIGAHQLRVYYPSAEEPNKHFLESFDPIPDNVSPQEPLYVAPSIDNPSKKLKRSFPIGMLLPPMEVAPYSINMPEFVPTDKLDSIGTMIQHDFESKSEDDSQEGFNRVPPMALVRCSRGGKTRALTEIAKRIRTELNCAVLFVTFNEWSSVRPDEQDDPLGALCRRIAFVSLKDFRPKSEEWNKFYDMKFAIDSQDILYWLNDSPAVLLVDELNNLSTLARKDSVEASNFGNFIKANFLDKANRYFIFSSHVLGALEYFAHYVDPSRGSIRPVILQELPILTNLATAMQLKGNLGGPREAIYYGLMPSMLHELNESRPITGRRSGAVTEYLEAPISEGKREKDFKDILRTIITGNHNDVPEPLQILLDSYVEDNDKKIRWVPFHFEYLMDRLCSSEKAFPSSSAYRYLARELKILCSQQCEAKEHSGDAWEGLFVLLLLVRAISSMVQEHEANEDGSPVPHGNSLLPGTWFVKSPNVTFNQSYRHSMIPFTSCTTWTDLKAGLYLEDGSQISIFYPKHATFEVYDVIAVYSENKEIIETYGYQCKEGKANSGQDVHPDFTCSFVLKGDPPENSLVERKKWLVPSEKHIENFFGSSGKLWTPKEWRRLLSTV